jgi:heme-degrading monooxygenase HmoA
LSETYTSGIWTVKPGHEDEFVSVWTDFVTWAKQQPGSGAFRLVRDVDNPNRYFSFAPWETFEAQRLWKETEEFAARMKRVREHVDGFEPSTYELVTTVE